MCHPNPTELEDHAGDILAKAQKGKRLGHRALSAATGLSQEAIQEAIRGEAPDHAYQALAETLDLAVDPLRAIARHEYFPHCPDLPTNFHNLTTRYKDFSVNAYLIGDATTGEAALFDTGTNASPLLEIVTRENWKLTHVFLTHTHRDHIMDLEKVQHRHSPEIWTGWEEPWPGARTFREGRAFNIGQLTLKTLSTKGHAKGGITYLIEGLAPYPIAVVGDAVFAGSIGGPLHSYQEAKQTIIDHLFPLPDNTLLAPGHGPLTTLAQEKEHNPFLAAWRS